MSLLVSLLALLGVSLSTWVGHRLLAWLLGQADEPVPYLRGLTVVGLPLTALVGALALSVAGFGDWLAGALPVAGRATELLVGLAYAVLVPVPVTAAYAGVLPDVEAARDLDLGRWGALGRLYRYGAVLLALAVLVLHGLLLALDGGVAVLAVGVPLVFAAIVWGAPTVQRLVGPTRAPADGERSRLEELCERAGVDPRGLLVQETRGSEQAASALRGPPGRRTLLVTDHFLAAYDDGVATALLASNAARARRFHVEHRLAPAAALVLALLAVVGGGVPLWTPLAVLLVAVPLQLWGYRRVYAADADAADRVGAAEVLAAFERASDVNDHGGGNRLVGLLAMRPPLERRMKRLREWVGGDESEEPGEVADGTADDLAETAEREGETADDPDPQH